MEVDLNYLAVEMFVINTKWDVPNIKSTVGSQTKIYIRPIQSDLNTDPANAGESKTGEIWKKNDTGARKNLKWRNSESTLSYISVMEVPISSANE